MNVTNTKSINNVTDDKSSKTSSNKGGNTSFSDELKNIKKQEELKKQEDLKKKEEETSKTDSTKKGKDTDKAINGLNDTIEELNKLNQKDESEQEKIKNGQYGDDIKNINEVFGLIDNNMNLQEQQDKFNVQTGANMNFNSDGQPFAGFVNQEKSKQSISSSQKDLAEENAILSTMEENIAIANKNMAIAKTKTVQNEQGIHKIDNKTNLVVDTIVDYSSVIMDKADVEFFTNLIENGILDMNEVKHAQKSSQVSKTLADLLAKAMNDNKPIRIDFDSIMDSKIDGKKVDIICDDASYKVMFTNKNLAKLFFDYISSHI